MPRKVRRAWPRTLLLLALIAVALVLLAHAGVFHGFSSVPRAVLTPVFQMQRGVLHGVSKIFGAPFLVGRQETEIADLSRQVQILTVQNAQLLELKTENSALRRTLNFFEAQKFPYLVARVIGRVEEGDNIFFIINRGRTDGAIKGQPIVSDGVLIGKITRVSDAASVVSPLTSTNVKTAAAFAGNAKTEEIIEGELNAGITMTLIPNDVALKEGMTVITSGLENGIPRGLVIGEIAQIESNPNALFQSADIKPTATLESGAMVSIITSHDAQ